MEIIKKYAHDYRDMKMSEEELEKMLNNFAKELPKLSKLFITEDIATNRWILSFGKPEFQGGVSIVIDKKTAKEILSIQNK